MLSLSAQQSNLDQQAFELLGVKSYLNSATVLTTAIKSVRVEEYDREI